MSHPAALESLLLAFRSNYATGKGVDICWPWKAERVWKGTADCWAATDGRRLAMVPVARLESPVFGLCKLPEVAADRRRPELKTIVPNELWSDAGWSDLDSAAPTWRDSLQLRAVEDNDVPEGYSLDCEAEILVCELRIAALMLYDLLPHRPFFKPSQDGRAVLAMGDAFRGMIMALKDGTDGE